MVLPEGVEARQKREAEEQARWEEGLVVYRLELPELPPLPPTETRKCWRTLVDSNH